MPVSLWDYYRKGEKKTNEVSNKFVYFKCDFGGKQKSIKRKKKQKQLNGKHKATAEITAKTNLFSMKT